MKNKKKIFLILAVLLFSSGLNVSALSKAVLMSLTPIQHAPENVHPNISGNINSHIAPAQSSKAQDIPDSKVLSGNANNSGIGAQALKSNNHWYDFWWIYILGFCAVALLFYLIKKNKRR